eukprot:scaffold166858_cov30-Tisochrysis_lutea.AAC.1
MVEEAGRHIGCLSACESQPPRQPVHMRNDKGAAPPAPIAGWWTPPRWWGGCSPCSSALA